MQGEQLLLVAGHGLGLGRGDEAGADPDPVGAEAERGGEATAVGDAAGGHHGDPLADGVDDLRDQGQGGDLAGVPPGLGALGHDDVAARLDGGDGVAHLAAHVDHDQVALVAEVDHVAGHAEPGHEDGAAAVRDLVDLPLHVVGGGGQEVDAEGLVGGGPDGSDLVAHLLVAHGRGAQATEAAGLRHRGDDAGVGDPAHPRQHHRVLDLQGVGQSRAHGGGAYARS